MNWSYHANDNAFLNYGDQWFSQRTLVARFMMNESVSRFGKKGDVVEVLPNFSLELVHLSGIYNSNTIGHSKTHSESNENVELSWKRTSAECERDAERVEGFGTHYGYGSVETTLGTIVTTRQDSLRKEFSILLYDSNGTNANNSINRTIDVKLNGVERICDKALAASINIPKSCKIVERRNEFSEISNTRTISSTERSRNFSGIKDEDRR